MEKIYSLKELQAMKEATENVIGERIAELTKAQGPMTAGELEQNLDGLCSKYDIANRLHSWRPYATVTGYIGHTRIDRECDYRTRTRRLAELDENDNIVRIFTETTGWRVNVYSAK